MFTYSLTGLELSDADDAPVEVEENETTARSAVYQVLGRVFGSASGDIVADAAAGTIAADIAEAATGLPYAFDVSAASLDAGVDKDTYAVEFERLLGWDGDGGGGEGRPALARTYLGEGVLEEVTRFYEYFGLAAAGEGGRPIDHIATECDFLQYLTFREAASTSPRLAASYRRAQLDFLDRHASKWVGDCVGRIGSLEPVGFLGWATGVAGAFIAADHDYARSLQGG